MKTMTIEDLVSWAYRQELPKEGAGGRGGGTMVAGSSWSMVSDMAALGTLIDVTNSYGVVPGFVADGEPHADAVLVGDAVAVLLGDVDVPAGWQPFPDWPDEHGLIAASIAAAVERWHLKPAEQRRRHVMTMVARAATLKRGPEWQAVEPKVRMVMRGGKPAWFKRKVMTDRFGRQYEIEMDGRDARNHRPARGAYRKFELSHDVGPDVLSRLDYQLWVSALESVQEQIAGRLTCFLLSPFTMDRAPWRRKPATAGV